MAAAIRRVLVSLAALAAIVGGPAASTAARGQHATQAGSQAAAPPAAASAVREQHSTQAGSKVEAQAPGAAHAASVQAPAHAPPPAPAPAPAKPDTPRAEKAEKAVTDGAGSSAAGPGAAKAESDGAKTPKAEAEPSGAKTLKAKAEPSGASAPGSDGAAAATTAAQPSLPEVVTRIQAILDGSTSKSAPRASGGSGSSHRSAAVPVRKVRPTRLLNWGPTFSPGNVTLVWGDDLAPPGASMSHDLGVRLIWPPVER